MKPHRREGDAVLLQPGADGLVARIQLGRLDGDDAAGNERRIVVIDRRDLCAVGHIEIGARKVAHELCAVRYAEFIEFRGALFRNALESDKFHFHEAAARAQNCARAANILFQ